MSLEFLGHTTPAQDAALSASIDALNILPPARPDLARIVAYCDAAPAGPWTEMVEDWPDDDGTPRQTGVIRCAGDTRISGVALFVQHCPEFGRNADARAFAAAARTDLPAIVDYCRRLEEENVHLSEALQAQQATGDYEMGQANANAALAADNARLRGMVLGLTERVAAQSELLSRRAETHGQP